MTKKAKFGTSKSSGKSKTTKTSAAKSSKGSKKSRKEEEDDDEDEDGDEDGDDSFFDSDDDEDEGDGDEEEGEDDDESDDDGDDEESDDDEDSDDEDGEEDEDDEEESDDEDDDDDEEDKGKKAKSDKEELGSVDYFVTGQKNLDRAKKAASFGGNRRLGIWVPEDQTHTLWFKDPEPIGGVWRHFVELPSGGKMVFCPNTKDCPICESNRSKQFIQLFLCVDETGYTPKKGKPVKWKVGVFEVGSTQSERLERTLRKSVVNPRRYDLTRCGIDVSSSKNSRGQVEYDFEWQEPRKTPKEISGAKWTTRKEILKAYAPPSMAELKKIAREL